jgi:Tfp pilus assembly protein PilF
MNGSDNLKPLIICLGLALITLSTFWQVQYHDFINLDDQLYVYKNDRVLGGLTLENILWAFNNMDAGFWHPLTWLSHMLDATLYGLNPKGHHMNSLLLHTLNALLLFILLRRMTGAMWRSALVSALFALHPLHVESVAWVAERKDVLSSLFWMLTLLAYVHWVKKRKTRTYLLTFVLFLLGLMAKPMLVTLPFVMLLLDYWPLKRFRWQRPPHLSQSENDRPVVEPEREQSPRALIMEKIPFFSLSLAACVVAFTAETGHGALPSLAEIPWQLRLSNAAVSYASYLWKTIWPQHLSVFYPLLSTPPWWQVSGAFLLIACLTLLSILRARSHGYLLIGWFWFLGTLVPVIGLVQIGAHAMADRYTYIPLIGIMLIISWGIHRLLAARSGLRVPVYSAVVFWIVLLIMATRIQVGTWKDSTSLFQHALKVTSHNYLAHSSLAGRLKQEKSYEEAIGHYQASLKINPRNPNDHANLGSIYLEQGREEEAFYHYSKAVQLNPSDYGARNNLGYLLSRQGRFEEAVVHFSEGLKSHPGDQRIRLNLERALQKMKESRRREDSSHGAPAKR